MSTRQARSGHGQIVSLDDHRGRVRAAAPRTADPGPIIEETSDFDEQAKSMCSTTIADLGELRLRAPLAVLLQFYEGEVIATWPEVEAWASGESEAVAINRLKDQIVALYRELAAIPDEQLGRLPMRWKRALGAAVVP
jgi:hypothetical protein